MKKFLLTIFFTSFAIFFLYSAGININAGGAIHCYNDAYYNINTGTLTVDSSADNYSDDTKSVSSSTDFNGPEGANDKLTINPSSSLGSTTVVNHGGVRHPNSTKAIHRWWKISPTTENTSTITFRMRTTELDGKTLSDLIPYEWDGSNWKQMTATYSTSGTSGNYSYITYTNFDFTSSKGAHEITLNNETPLPVTLAKFTALMVNGVSTLNWMTYSELNNLGWNIYRSPSKNFAQAKKVNSDLIEGAGTTSQQTIYTYKDVFTPEISTYYYWLESVSFSGETVLTSPIELNIDENQNQEVPQELLKYGLHQNYPNPFNPSTQISFILKKDENVTLEIYNIKGQKVRTLLNNESVKKNIMKTVVWNGTNNEGKKVSSGVYLYRLVAGKRILYKKMLMSK